MSLEGDPARKRAAGDKAGSYRSRAQLAMWERDGVVYQSCYPDCVRRARVQDGAEVGART